jgi:hypothetical protein
MAAVSNIDVDTIPVRTPDKFDGTNPEKLESFEGQCRMVFLGDEHRYDSSRKQALFAGSYLDGFAYDWWLQELRKSDVEFRRTSDNFWNILRERFGNPDHTRTVERELTLLQMKDTDHVNRHIVRFDTLANQLKWNEPALRSRFELSLNARLRDDLGRMEPSVMRKISTMKERVLALDRRFWERQDEIKRERVHSDSSDRTPNKSGLTSSLVSSPSSSSPPSPSPPSEPLPEPANTPSDPIPASKVKAPKKAASFSSKN